MAINSNIKQKRGEVSVGSPALLYRKITTSRARIPRDRIMWTEGQKKNLREEAGGNNEQFSNTEIQRWDVVSQ